MVIHPDRFGQSHYSLFLELDRWITDNRGILKTQSLRRRHPQDESYQNPSRLQNGEIAENHDDYDCLDDLQAAGWIDVIGQTVVFTSKGWEIIGRLRRHRIVSAKLETFDWRSEPTRLVVSEVMKHARYWKTVAKISSRSSTYDVAQFLKNNFGQPDANNLDMMVMVKYFQDRVDWEYVARLLIQRDV